MLFFAPRGSALVALVPRSGDDSQNGQDLRNECRYIKNAMSENIYLFRLPDSKGLTYCHYLRRGQESACVPSLKICSVFAVFKSKCLIQAVRMAQLLLFFLETLALNSSAHCSLSNLKFRTLRYNQDFFTTNYNTI